MSAVLSSSTRKPIETTFSRPGGPAGSSRFATSSVLGWILPSAPAESAVDAEHPRDAEPPDVGVEHADRQAPGRERGREVHRDRRLADAALAAGDGQDPGRGGDLGARRVLARVQAGALHRRRLLLLGHLAVLDADVR